MRIGVIITSYGPINAHVYHSHLAALLDWSKDFDLKVFHLADNQQESSLNSMSTLALERGCDRILYLEHDNLYPKTMLTNLAKHDLDVVTGYYTFRNWPFLPIPLLKDKENGLIYRYEYNTGRPTENVMEMDTGCFGCCLVKRKVLEVLTEKGLAFRREYNPKSKGSYTADVVFFQDVLNNGFKVHVDGNVRVGHLTSGMVITPDNYRLFREFFRTIYPELVPSEDRLSKEDWRKRVEFLLKEDGNDS